MVADASHRQYPPRDPSKPRRKKIDYLQAGTLLATGMDWPEIAPLVGAKNGEVLRVCCAKKGVTKGSVRNLEPKGERRITVTAKLATEAEAVLRERLNGGLLQAADALLSKRPSYKTLANRGQGHASTLETLSRTWRNLNGSPDSLTIQFGVERQGGLRSSTPQPVIDCPVSVPSKPESSQ